MTEHPCHFKNTLSF